MPLPFHLIDGYNLMHAALLARERYGPGDMQRARTALLLRIADGLSEDERRRTSVIFDAHDPPFDRAGNHRFYDMQVLFAVDYPDADDLIEELIRRHSSPGQLRVVSDDLRLKKAIKRRGGKAVGCESFLKRISAGSRELSGLRPVEQAPDGQTEAEEVETWLDFFGVKSQESIAAAETAALRPATASPAKVTTKPLASPNAKVKDLPSRKPSSVSAASRQEKPHRQAAPDWTQDISHPDAANENENDRLGASDRAGSRSLTGSRPNREPSEVSSNEVALWQAQIDALTAAQRDAEFVKPEVDDRRHNSRSPRKK